MRSLMIAAGVALFLAGNLSANAPAPPQPKPTTKSTAPAPNAPPRLESDTTRGSTTFIGSALALTVASAGLLTFRRNSKQS